MRVSEHLMLAILMQTERDECRSCYALCTKVCFKKKFTHISAYYANSDCFGEKSLKSAKSTHAKDSKMVRQVHIVPKLLPGSMINHKNYFWEITKFVKKWFAKKGDLAFLSIM